ncbi:hypothetical protein HPP92_016405 [Vanilla planifolia]|uniref:Uncharacterized protein n=1 Tax=Vanilla planifolia TaxID=51239 RepID=A0A835QG14_VANPL|nr:hypothetical protein HPP92_016405 [Vanilla planifolia]
MVLQPLVSQWQRGRQILQSPLPLHCLQVPHPCTASGMHFTGSNNEKGGTALSSQDPLHLCIHLAHLDASLPCKQRNEAQPARRLAKTVKRGRGKGETWIIETNTSKIINLLTFQADESLKFCTIPGAWVLTWTKVRECPFATRLSIVHFRAFWLLLSLLMATATSGDATVSSSFIILQFSFVFSAKAASFCGSSASSFPYGFLSAYVSLIYIIVEEKRVAGKNSLKKIVF